MDKKINWLNNSFVFASKSMGLGKYLVIKLIRATDRLLVKQIKKDGLQYINWF
jgi:hypothetical protein